MNINAIRKDSKELQQSLFEMLISSNCVDELCSAALLVDDKDENLYIAKVQMKLEEDFRTHTFTEKGYDLDEIKQSLSSIIDIHINNYPEDEPEKSLWKDALAEAHPDSDTSLYLNPGSV